MPNTSSYKQLSANELCQQDYTAFNLSINNNIAHIELSRPDALNSMIPEFWYELPECVRAIDDNAAARVIVISAQGKHFSAGMDLAVFAGMAVNDANAKGEEPGRRAEQLRRGVLELQDAFSALEKIRIPVLAAIQGGAIGGAIDMICACDSRYSTKDAFFCIKETQLGITADVGTLQRLGDLMAHGVVRELTYTGRNMLADEALQHGFINQVFDNHESLIEGVMKIAQQIAVHSPLAIAGCKEMLNYSRDHTVDESLNYMATWQSGMLQMPDVQEAMLAGKEKRMPVFDALKTRHHHMKK